VTAEAHAHVRFRRAIERRALWAAEDAARELPNLPLEDALQLVRLYAGKESPKYEKAALRWLERYVDRSRALAWSDRRRSWSSWRGATHLVPTPASWSECFASSTEHAVSRARYRLMTQRALRDAISSDEKEHSEHNARQGHQALPRGWASVRRLHHRATLGAGSASLF
jgi:hypothetical protein